MAIRLIAAFVVPTDLSGQNCSEEFFSSVLRPKVNLSFRCLLFDWGLILPVEATTELVLKRLLSGPNSAGESHLLFRSR